MGKPNYPIRIIGTRHGEKKYESLLSREEMVCATDMGNYYRIPPDLQNLNYAKYVDLGKKILLTQMNIIPITLNSWMLKG